MQDNNTDDNHNINHYDNGNDISVDNGFIDSRYHNVNITIKALNTDSAIVATATCRGMFN